MRLKQSEFQEPFSYEAPILPDSLDRPIAFFYAVNQPIRFTQTEILATRAPQNPNVGAPFDSPGGQMRDSYVG
jgi:hypothetical protein